MVAFADTSVREEVIPIHGIVVRVASGPWSTFRCEPGGREVKVRVEGKATLVEVPPLEIHQMLVGEE